MMMNNSFRSFKTRRILYHFIKNSRSSNLLFPHHASRANSNSSPFNSTALRSLSTFDQLSSPSILHSHQTHHNSTLHLFHSNSFHSMNASLPSNETSNHLGLPPSRSYRTWQRPNDPIPEPKPQPYRYLCILDFEATCDNNKTRFWPQEIIEFPVVVVDTSSLEIVDEFRYFIRPLINPKLTAFCKELTGIAQEEVDEGKQFPEVLQSLHQFLLEKCFDSNSNNPTALSMQMNTVTNTVTNKNAIQSSIAIDSNTVTNSTVSLSASDSASVSKPTEAAAYPFLFVTCGDWDLKRMLPAQTKLSNVSNIPEYLKTWANVKEIASQFYGNSSAWSMRTLLRFLKLPMVGRHHSGIDDSRNIANAVITMIKDGCVFIPTCNAFHAPSSSHPSSLFDQILSNSPPPSSINLTKSSSLSKPKSNSNSNLNRVRTTASGFDASFSKPKELETEFKEMEKEVFDIGANIIHPHLLPHIDEVLENSKKANVSGLLIPSSSLVSAEKALSVCQDKKYEDLGLYLVCAAGIHPHESEKMMRRYGKEEVVDQVLRNFVLESQSKVKAIGECGLDFEKAFCARRNQEYIFSKQIDLAIELKLPLLMHERKAHDYFVSIFESKSNQVKSLIRCFTGSLQEMEKYIEMGCFLGISGIICDERISDALIEVVSRIPLDKIVLESNAPYHLPRNIPADVLTKDQKRNKRNEPNLLPWVAHKLARIKNVSASEIVEISNQNVRSFFQSEKILA